MYINNIFSLYIIYKIYALQYAHYITFYNNIKIKIFYFYFEITFINGCNF